MNMFNKERSVKQICLKFHHKWRNWKYKPLNLTDFVKSWWLQITILVKLLMAFFKKRCKLLVRKFWNFIFICFLSEFFSWAVHKRLQKMIILCFCINKWNGFKLTIIWKHTHGSPTSDIITRWKSRDLLLFYYKANKRRVPHTRKPTRKWNAILFDLKQILFCDSHSNKETELTASPLN